MTKLLEKDFDKLIPVTHYTLVKVTGRNKLFIVDPSDTDSAFIIDGLIAEFYSLINGVKTIQEYVEEFMVRNSFNNSEAIVVVKNAVLELLSLRLIELSRKNEKEKIKKIRT